MEGFSGARSGLHQLKGLDRTINTKRNSVSLELTPEALVWRFKSNHNECNMFPFATLTARLIVEIHSASCCRRPFF